MKFLVYEIRSQMTRERIVRIRAPERVKEIQPDGKHFKWLKGFEQVDGNTIKIFGRRLIFRELIFCSVSADDGEFWRDEHATVVLDLTKESEDAEHRRAVEGRAKENQDSRKESGNQESQRGFKKVAPKVKMR